MGVSAAAATGLPFAEIPGVVADKILTLCQTVAENREDVETLLGKVKNCNKLVSMILENLNTGNWQSTELKNNVIPFLDDILDGFFHILDVIGVRCDK